MAAVSETQCDAWRDRHTGSFLSAETLCLRHSAASSRREHSGPSMAENAPAIRAYVANTTLHGLVVGLVFGAFSGIDDAVRGVWPPRLAHPEHNPAAAAALTGTRWPSSLRERFVVVGKQALSVSKYTTGMTLAFSVASAAVQVVRGHDNDGLDAAAGTFVIAMLHHEVGATAGSRLAQAAALAAIVGAAKTILYSGSGAPGRARLEADLQRA